eukprot:TRINITY_DN17567_c0_g1_i1.p1 TRINITY_DN17567_c0_g1~~TRINITY_DN17567_c0_g1_i1.p1  ORF type:complete len:130 (-),score=11.47 TRINITY_DN17567_c0_g1_i1:117-506(-)
MCIRDRYKQFRIQTSNRIAQLKLIEQTSNGTSFKAIHNFETIYKEVEKYNLLNLLSRNTKYKKTELEQELMAKDDKIRSYIKMSQINAKSSVENLKSFLDSLARDIEIEKKDVISTMLFDLVSRTGKMI